MSNEHVCQRLITTTRDMKDKKLNFIRNNECAATLVVGQLFLELVLRFEILFVVTGIALA